MSIRTIVQSKLDNVLFDSGILSYHIRRVKTDTITVSAGGRSIAVNNDEYVVFRVVSSKRRTYGDGSAKLVQRYIDVNYYYKYAKSDARFDAVENRVNSIISEFLSDKRFRLANDQSDIYDIDNPYRGINVEFLYVGLVSNG